MRMGGPAGGGQERHRVIAALLGACLCLLLAACSGGSSPTTQATMSATTSGAATTVTTGNATQGAVPTFTPIDEGTPGAQLGSGDYCASQPNVSAALPGNIPTYPGAQMLLGQTQGSTGVFALCTSDSVQTVDAFYAAQLPANNWQQITNTQVTSSQQLTACSGACDAATPPPGAHVTNLIITIEPDTSGGFQTQVVILYSGT